MVSNKHFFKALINSSLGDGHLLLGFGIKQLIEKNQQIYSKIT